jgi:hypothetical protein
MENRLKSLKERAKTQAELRGHKMGPWKAVKGGKNRTSKPFAQCYRCQAMVLVDTKQSFDNQIRGMAASMNCTGR